jgi:hypothetical protein
MLKYAQIFPYWADIWLMGQTSWGGFWGGQIEGLMGRTSLGGCLDERLDL